MEAGLEVEDVGIIAPYSAQVKLLKVITVLNNASLCSQCFGSVPRSDFSENVMNSVRCV